MGCDGGGGDGGGGGGGGVVVERGCGKGVLVVGTQGLWGKGMGEEENGDLGYSSSSRVLFTLYLTWRAPPAASPSSAECEGPASPAPSR